MKQMPKIVQETEEEQNAENDRELHPGVARARRPRGRGRRYQRRRICRNYWRRRCLALSDRRIVFHSGETISMGWREQARFGLRRAGASWNHHRNAAWPKYVFTVAAGILPAVEPGILPGGFSCGFRRQFLAQRCHSGRQDAALYGSQDGRRYTR